MNLQSGVRPINSSIDRSVDILSEAPGVIGCAGVNLDFVSVAGQSWEVKVKLGHQMDVYKIVHV